jgi:REP-associated tyrosine transposase
MKREKFVEGGIYHVFNKSIAGYGIFKDIKIADRFVKVLDYYNKTSVTYSLSKALIKKKYFPNNLLYPKSNALIKFISYCFMPDHYHLLIKILSNNCLSKFINNVENSFTRYFNIRFERKGPLYQTAFKTVRINSNEQLLHVSRYIHLNPTTAGLVQKPEDWMFSSYQEFITNDKILKEIMTEISIKSINAYKKFVEDQKDYQRKLARIKKFLLD